DAMLKEIEATAPTNRLSNAARAARLADLDAEQLDVERQEAALIERAAADGITVEHPPDASPLAVLSIAIIARRSRPTWPRPHKDYPMPQALQTQAHAEAEEVARLAREAIALAFGGTIAEARPEAKPRPV